ncbi:MAG: uroporphyrinogen decarboxylase [FCB group bacterium]|nr:uroporphyrinogen decarboxylase [FCB group bacterium]
MDSDRKPLEDVIPDTYNSRERFLAACARKPLSRPPIWVMRQAGRYLPEYRELKGKYDFVTMVQTPELATRVTLQPIQRFGFDAAIMFSDILVIPEAMGQPYSFRKQGGIAMEYAVSSQTQIDALTPENIPEKLNYVAETIKLTRKELGDKTALIGFGGAPWTLAVYMVEGGSSAHFAKIKSLFYSAPDLFESLMRKVTTALIRYFEMQIASGVDAIQLFDSWGSLLTENSYWDASGKYLAEIVSAVNKRVPMILFSKGTHHWVDKLRRINCDVYSLDWTASLAKFHDAMGGRVAVQGNLDPVVLNTEPEIVRREALKILNDFGTRKGHIFNLGHGILPDAKIACVEELISTVQSYNIR